MALTGSTATIHECLENQETFECPICFQKPRLGISLCANRHWLCLPCAEQLLCQATIYPLVMSTVCVNASLEKPCPMCRGGNVHMAENPRMADVSDTCLSVGEDSYASEDVIAGNIYAFLGTHHRKPIQWRSWRYANHLKAIEYWLAHPQFTYKCSQCTRALTRQRDQPVASILQLFHEECTLCPICNVTLPWDQACDHWNQEHADGDELPIIAKRYLQRVK